MSTFHPVSVARWLSGLCAFALLAACATGPRVTAEADPRVDFSQYRTFAFYSPLAIEKEGYSSPTSDRLKAAVRREMEARGYVYTTENPDLLANINAYMERRTDVSTTPWVDYGYYYSYRAHRYVVVPYWTERTDVYRYTEGTINVDLVDADRNALVWEGIAVGRAANLQPADRDARIDSVVSDIFARYPYRAGSGSVAAQ